MSMVKLRAQRQNWKIIAYELLDETYSMSGHVPMQQNLIQSLA